MSERWGTFLREASELVHRASAGGREAAAALTALAMDAHVWGMTPLAQLCEAMAAHAGDHPVARPATWAAVVLVPRRVEVWQAELGGPAHDRFLYERPPRGSTWEARRLRP